MDPCWLLSFLALPGPDSGSEDKEAVDGFSRDTGCLLVWTGLAALGFPDSAPCHQEGPEWWYQGSDWPPVTQGPQCAQQPHKKHHDLG